MMSLDCLINEVDVQATIERDDFEKDGGFARVWVRVRVCACVWVRVCACTTHHPTHPLPPSAAPLGAQAVAVLQQLFEQCSLKVRYTTQTADDKQ